MQKKIYTILSSTMQAIANNVREKSHRSGSLYPFQIIDIINYYWPAQWTGTETQYKNFAKPLIEYRYYITELDNPEDEL